MREHKNFWDRNAGRYDRFMRKDQAAYEKIYALLRPVVKAKTVLELATGTGLIAKHIVNAAAHIEATDASPEMIAEAKRDNRSAKLHFSVQDMFRLPYADKSFDAVIVSNALHIVPQPEKVLAEIRRVLKDDGVLIAPTFTHAGPSCSIGLVPTRLMVPFSTFQNCGNSSSDVFLINSPIPVFLVPSGRILFPITRGSKSILNIRPSLILFCAISSALRSSASMYILRNLYILNGFPF